MARQLNVAGWVDRYVNGMAGASTRYTQGIDRVTDSPMAKAADAVAAGRALAGYQAAQAKMEAHLRSSSLPDWKTKAKTVGAQRLATGAAAARPKLNAYVTAAASSIQNLMNTIAAMPKGGAANAKARSAAWIDGMMQISGQH